MKKEIENTGTYNYNVLYDLSTVMLRNLKGMNYFGLTKDSKDIELKDTTDDLCVFGLFGPKSRDLIKTISSYKPLEIWTGCHPER